MKNKRIVQCWIEEERYQNVIRVKYGNENEAWERLGVYYPDESHFIGSEFIGLTKDEALDLMRSKDIAYLRS